MNKKLLVVTKNPETYFMKRLIREVGQASLSFFNPWHDPEPIGFDKIIFRTSGVYHSERDLDFVRRQTGAEVFNPLSCLEIFRAKSSQYIFFNQAHHPSLPWKPLSDESYFEWQIEEFLVKPDFGQGGWGIEVMGKDALYQWVQEKQRAGDLSWIVQPYLSACEYRVFFTESERFTLKREATTRIAANFASGGIASLVTLPLHLHSPVEALIADSGALYGAIDLLDTPSGPVFLELNVVPSIEQLEHLSSINIMKLILSANFFCQTD